MELVWDAAQEDLSVLKEVVTAMLADLESAGRAMNLQRIELRNKIESGSKFSRRSTQRCLIDVADRGQYAKAL